MLRRFFVYKRIYTIVTSMKFWCFIFEIKMLNFELTVGESSRVEMKIGVLTFFPKKTIPEKPINTLVFSITIYIEKIKIEYEYLHENLSKLRMLVLKHKIPVEYHMNLHFQPWIARLPMILQ